MTLSSFDDLLQAARQQPQRQRLLFVLAAAGVDDDATAAQRARFAAGEGGTLTPLMTVDKAPDELTSLQALLAESQLPGTGHGPCDVVFVAALSGTAHASPNAVQCGAALQRMVASIKAGDIGNFIAFDSKGLPLRFS